MSVASNSFHCEIKIPKRDEYIVIALSALTLGLGAAYWRAGNEIGLRIQAATHLAAMAQAAAEDQAGSLGEKLQYERTARKAAERARSDIQAQFSNARAWVFVLSARLQQEISARQLAEMARIRAESEIQAAKDATIKAQAEARSATQRLALEIKAHEAAATSDRGHRTAERKQRVSRQPGLPVKKRRQDFVAGMVRSS